MTNGTVGQEVTSTAGDTLEVAYEGGGKTLVVPAGSPVVTLASGDKTMLTPGQHVIVQARPGAGGVLTADRVIVGKDGLVRPM